MAMTAGTPPEILFADPDAPNYPARFHRGWALQRIGWAIMAALTAAGLAGAFGGATTRTEAPRLGVEYERFLRLGRDTALTFRIDGHGPTELWLDTDYVGSLRIEAVTPRPRAERAEPDRALFLFELSGPAEVTFHVRPLRAGPLAGRVGVGAAAGAELRHFVYP